MKICAVVAEYDPFHNGHAYQLAAARAAGATHIAVIMSGNAVQRADFALCDKFTRAQLALAGGADAVFELPAAFACAAANRFAFGAISAVAALGSVEMLSFGCENADADALGRAAALTDTAAVRERTGELLKTGLGFPAAVQTAAAESDAALAALLREPNNVLAIEYLRAAQQLGLNLQPVAVPRAGAAHGDAAPDGRFASAGALRRLLRAGEDVGKYVPPFSAVALTELRERGAFSGGLDAVECALLYKLRCMTRADFAALPDCADGLGDRLYNAARAALTLPQLWQLAAAKRYTSARVRRAALCAFFGICAQNYDDGVPYLRLLACSKRGTELLAAVKPAVPLSQSLKKLQNTSPEAARCAALEVRVGDVFALSLAKRAPAALDYTRKFAAVSTMEIDSDE